VSRESQEIFDRAWQDYQRTGNAQALAVAAQGHIGASRPLPQLVALYAEAMAGQEHHTYEQAAAAQAIADELDPVRTAHRVIEGYLPRTEGDGPNRMV
jgi:hypothetical protein